MYFHRGSAPLATIAGPPSCEIAVALSLRKIWRLDEVRDNAHAHLMGVDAGLDSPLQIARGLVL